MSKEFVDYLAKYAEFIETRDTRDARIRAHKRSIHKALLSLTFVRIAGFIRDWRF